MNSFFNPFDWHSFWLNVLVNLIFLVLSILLAIRFIPSLIFRLVKKRNKFFIVKKKSSIIQEICEYLNTTPFKDEEINREKIFITTSRKDKRNYRFVSISNINVFNKIVYPSIRLVIYDYFKNLNFDDSFSLLKNERLRLEDLRERLEKIIAIHSLFLEEILIQDVSDLCLEIRAFEIKFEFNYVVESLFENKKSEILGVSGVSELTHLYEKILNLLFNMLNDKYFDIEIKEKS